jgi:hypothetical protein
MYMFYSKWILILSLFSLKQFWNSKSYYTVVSKTNFHDWESFLGLLGTFMFYELLNN